jgi:hypothetical protein
MGAKKGKRGLRKAASHSMFVQDLYTKNPILVVGSVFAILFVLALATYLVVNPSIGQTVYTDAGIVTEEEQTAAVNAVYGKITKIAGASLEVRVEVGDSVVPFSFTYDDNTSFSVFAYADDEDLVGSETAISSNEISVGDTVSVYTKEAPGMTSSQRATRIVKIAQ